jgi:hypothetical protein
MATIDLGKIKITFGGEWDNSKEYEELTIVKHNGDAYMSKVAVPSGTDISDSGYWEPIGVYSDEDILNKVKNVDGAGSGLDADTIDGVQLEQIYLKNEVYNKNEIDVMLNGLLTQTVAQQAQISILKS